MNGRLIGGQTGAALFVVATDQEHRVIGSGAEQDRTHEPDGEF